MDVMLRHVMSTELASSARLTKSLSRKVDELFSGPAWDGVAGWDQFGSTAETNATSEGSSQPWGKPFRILDTSGAFVRHLTQERRELEACLLPSNDVDILLAAALLLSNSPATHTECVALQSNDETGWDVLEGKFDVIWAPHALMDAEANTSILGRCSQIMTEGGRFVCFDLLTLESGSSERGSADYPAVDAAATRLRNAPLGPCSWYDATDDVMTYGQEGIVGKAWQSTECDVTSDRSIRTHLASLFLEGNVHAVIGICQRCDAARDRTSTSRSSGGQSGS